MAGHGLGSPGTSVRVSKALEMLTEVAALRADRGRAEYRPQMAAGPHTTAPPPPAQERARGAGERAHMRFRTITRNARALPDFLLIGGQRCGSTSLYTTLCGHPQVLAGAHKEPHFFDNNHLRGEHFYRRLFPLRAHLRARRAITGEATTHYLSHPAVPGRVAAMLPDVRLIAILRDPVERAYSHYQLAHRNGREPLSFEQALAAEPERLAGEEARLLSDPAYRGEAYGVQSYRTRGLYLEQLERWWASVSAGAAAGAAERGHVPAAGRGVRAGGGVPGPAAGHRAHGIRGAKPGRLQLHAAGDAGASWPRSMRSRTAGWSSGWAAAWAGRGPEGGTCPGAAGAAGTACGQLREAAGAGVRVLVCERAVGDPQPGANRGAGGGARPQTRRPGDALAAGAGRRRAAAGRA